MGVATLGGWQFRIDPTSIQWSYNVKVKDSASVGGKVIQIFGTSVSDMTVEGSFGVGGWQEQERFLQMMLELAKDQVAEARNPSKEPLRFIYPPKGWDFKVMLKAYTSPDGPRSVRLSPTNFNPKWKLTLFIVEDNADLKRVATNAYIARLTKGIGWRQSEYNGGEGLENWSGLEANNQYAGAGSPAQADGVVNSGQFSQNVLRWKPLVERYFPTQYVTQALGIINCESGGNPNAVNGKPGRNNAGHASGLFQQMPAFWAERRAKAEAHFKVSLSRDILDPEANIAASAKLFIDSNFTWSHWECEPDGSTKRI